MDKQTDKYRPVFHFPEVLTPQWRYVPRYEIDFDWDTMQYGSYRFVGYELERDLTALRPHSSLTDKCLDYLLNKQMYNYNMKGHSPK